MFMLNNWWAEAVAQLVECLLSMYRAEFNPQHLMVMDFCSPRR